MKKTFALIIILVIIVIALVGFKFLGKGKTNSAQNKTQQTQVIPSQTTGESFTGKIKDAFTKNVPLKCTYKTDDKNSATAYLQNKKYYAEITSAGKLGYVILIDNCLWSWSKDQTQGVKMCFQPKEGEDIWTDVQNQDKTSNLDYNCAPAIVNDAVFTPPSNIKFSDFSELMKQATQSGQ